MYCIAVQLCLFKGSECTIYIKKKRLKKKARFKSLPKVRQTRHHNDDLTSLAWKTKGVDTALEVSMMSYDLNLGLLGVSFWSPSTVGYDDEAFNHLFNFTAHQGLSNIWVCILTLVDFPIRLSIKGKFYSGFEVYSPQYGARQFGLSQSILMPIPYTFLIFVLLLSFSSYCTFPM